MQGAGELKVLKISEILPNRFQPRIKFDDESLNQLAISIAKFGVIEPIVVRTIGKKYEIIAGERRFKASKIAGMSTIPCMVVSLSDKDSEELALLENVQRKALSPIEEAVSYKKILDSGYITRDELSRKIGKPQSLIFSKIKLLSLADEVQNYLLNNKISERHARSLLQLSSLSDQVKMLHRIVDERLTVKATDREISKILNSKRKIKTDDEAEALFDDERGKEKMDIDKIMQEAKDINGEDLPKAPQAPNLMETGVDKPSASLGSQTEAPVSEPGKFVSVQPAASSSPSAPAPSGVTFDNMFPSSVSTTNPVPLSQPTEPVASTPDLDTLMGGVTPLVQPSMTATPDLTSPMNEVKPEDNSTASFSNVAGGIIPDSFSGASALAPTQPVASSETIQPVSGETALTPEVLGTPEPSASPAVTPVSEPAISPTPVASATEPAVSPNPVAPAIEPAVSPTPVAPAIEPAVSPVPEVAASSEQPIAEVTPVMSQPAAIPEVPLVNLNQPASYDNVIPAPAHVDNQRVVINEQNGQSISDAVSDALKSAGGVSDVNVAPVQPEGPVNPVSTPSQNVVTEGEVPGFAKAISMIRQCAEEIKKSGYYVNVEEMDVDGQYKIIFTMDK